MSSAAPRKSEGAGRTDKRQWPCESVVVGTSASTQISEVGATPGDAADVWAAAALVT